MLARQNLVLCSTLCYQKCWRSLVVVKFNFNFQKYVLRFAHELPQANSIQHKTVENDFFYKNLQRNKKYVKSMAFLDFADETETDVHVNTILNMDLTDKPNYVFLNYLKIILHSFQNCIERFNESKFTDFCDILEIKLNEFTDDQLLDLLKVLSLWPRNERKDLFFKICKTLDEELVKREKYWTRDKLLLTMDHFYRLGLIKFSAFFWKKMRKMFNEPDKLTPAQLVHALFLINSQRMWHPSVRLFNVELAISDIIYDLSVEEIAIVALAFFKTQSKIKNSTLLLYMYDKVKLHVDSIDSLTLTAILKVLRLSTGYRLRHKITELLDELVDKIDDVSLTCCIHIALLGTQNVVFHPESLKKICDRLVKEISTARLKELERISFILELYNFDPQTEPNIFDSIVQELLKREEEIQSHPKILFNAVNYLTLSKIYNYELLNRVLSEQFLNDTFGKQLYATISCDVLQVSCGVKLECPDYKGNNLDEQFIRETSKKICWNMPNLLEKNLQIGSRIILCLKNVLERMYGGEEFVHYVFLLPYSPRPELILCLKDKKAVKIPESIKSQGNCLDVKPPPSIGDWYAFMFWGTCTTIADTNKPVASLLARVRHLKILGYKPLFVKETIWENLSVDKMVYVKQLIEENE